jgi:NAD(P)-dependent dehydrogenase (short-subunit alcohol dehydrogenase family)
LVSGGRNGLDNEIIKQLTKHNRTKIYMGARSKAKAPVAIAELKQQAPSVNIMHVERDLASFSSIERAAVTFLAENDSLHILVNNAGVFASPPGLTEDGYEVQFGTNYMGPALFTELLLPILEKTASISVTVTFELSPSAAKYMLAPKGGFFSLKIRRRLRRLVPRPAMASQNLQIFTSLNLTPNAILPSSF